MLYPSSTTLSNNCINSYTQRLKCAIKSATLQFSTGPAQNEMNTIVTSTDNKLYILTRIVNHKDTHYSDTVMKAEVVLNKL